LSSIDFDAIDFLQAYKSKDIETTNYFLRLGLLDKPISTDFILLRTDSIGNILRGRIVHVTNNTTVKKKGVSRFSGEIATTSLKRKDKVVKVVDDTTSNTSMDLLISDDGTTLPDVVVVGYIKNDNTPYYWYWYGGIVDVYSETGAGTYTYGPYEYTQDYTGGAGGVRPDETIDIEVEGTTNPAINLSSYINCFSSISNKNANYKITIFTDIPVNNDPRKLFDYTTGSCGHTFIQLTKSSNGETVQQTMGFYPQSGWKSIEANAPVTSKMVDNAGHEFNASLSVNVDAKHFQRAINEMEYDAKSKYDIDNYNCTDFALDVFNAAAPLYLDIPQYHIPGGMYGEVSNTPQGLYSKLSSLYEQGGASGYDGGTITIPGVVGYTGKSHGPCN